MIQEYIDKGLILKKGSWYYKVDEAGQHTTLGRKENAEAYAKELSNSNQTDSVKVPASETTSDENLPSPPEAHKVATSPKKVTKSKKSSNFEHILGEIDDLNPNLEGRADLSVLWNGIDVRLTANSVIKNCPLHFRWRRKSDVILNGSRSKALGYTVVEKEWKLPIEVVRDDTSNSNHYTNGGLILCCCKKDQYEKKTKLKHAKAILRPRIEQESRQAFVDRQAAETDPNVISSNYAMQNGGDAQRDIEYAEKEKGISAQEIYKKIDDIDSADQVLNYANKVSQTPLGY